MSTTEPRTFSRRPRGRTTPVRRTVRSALMAWIAVAVGLSAALAQPAPEQTEGATVSPPADVTSAPAVTLRPAHPMGLLLPDVEFVLGPTMYGFDIAGFVEDEGGYLARYTESVGGETLTGTEIVARVAADYGVGARLLLTLIEMHSGWVRDAEPAERAFAVDEPLPGLYAGLTAAADALNRPYYAHRYEDLRMITLADGAAVEVTDVNAGTFAVLSYLSRGTAPSEFAGMAAPSRFYNAWTSLFGDAYAFRVMETLPEQVPHVDLALPFGTGEVWYYVSGPHSPWGVGGPRAAIDFAPPPQEETGCHPSGAHVLAVADGEVLRSGASGVVIDLDGDAFEGTGWTHVYTHLSTVDRIPVGTKVKAGDVLGYPSCEGGLSSMTRVGFARRYNGEWVPADFGPAPLILGGWTAITGADPGQGWLARALLEAREAMPAKDPSRNGVAALPAEG